MTIGIKGGPSLTVLYRKETAVYLKCQKNLLISDSQGIELSVATQILLIISVSQKKQGTEERGCGLLRNKRLLIERIAQV